MQPYTRAITLLALVLQFLARKVVIADSEEENHMRNLSPDLKKAFDRARKYGADFQSMANFENISLRQILSDFEVILQNGHPFWRWKDFLYYCEVRMGWWSKRKFRFQWRILQSAVSTES